MLRPFIKLAAIASLSFALGAPQPQLDSARDTAAGVAGVDLFSSAPRSSSGVDGILPRGYIIEFSDDAEQQIAQHTKRSPSSINVHDEFHAYMARSIEALDLTNAGDNRKAKRGVLDELSAVFAGVLGTDSANQNVSNNAYKVRYSWDDSTIFRGVSVLLASDSYLSLLEKAPGVTRVSRIQTFSFPDLGGLMRPGQAVGQASPSVQDDSKALRDAITASASAQGGIGPHAMTGVDRLHAAGVTGQGVIIGVIDSSIDYTHPVLNGGKPSGTACFGKRECQVISGRNLAADGSPGDPYDKCTGHGTFTSSIIAARPAPGYNFTGR